MRPPITASSLSVGSMAATVPCSSAYAYNRSFDRIAQHMMHSGATVPTWEGGLELAGHRGLAAKPRGLDASRIPAGASRHAPRGRERRTRRWARGGGAGAQAPSRSCGAPPPQTPPSPSPRGAGSVAAPPPAGTGMTMIGRKLRVQVADRALASHATRVFGEGRPPRASIERPPTGLRV